LTCFLYVSYLIWNVCRYFLIFSIYFFPFLNLTLLSALVLPLSYNCIYIFILSVFVITKSSSSIALCQSNNLPLFQFFIYILFTYTNLMKSVFVESNVVQNHVSLLWLFSTFNVKMKLTSLGLGVIVIITYMY